MRTQLWRITRSNISPDNNNNKKLIKIIQYEKKIFQDLENNVKCVGGGLALALAITLTPTLTLTAILTVPRTCPGNIGMHAWSPSHTDL